MQMTLDYIEQNDVIRRYQLNRLTDEELDSFEVYILENPDIISVIEKDRVIQDAYREHQSLLKAEVPDDAGIARWRMLAMAACLVVAVVAVFNFNGSGPSYAVQPPVVLETFRGAGDNAVSLNGAPVVQFQIDMGPAELLDTNVFTAELRDSGDNVLFRTPGLTVDNDGWLFYILAEQEDTLSGRYTVNVYPDGNADRAVSFPVLFTTP